MKFKFNISLFILCVFFQIKTFAGIVILNGLSHIHETSTGSVVTGKIRVQNNGTSESKILIYTEDLILSCDRQSDYKTVNSHERSSGGWTKLNIEEKTLQENEIYDIWYTINVPENVKGSYWSVIMIEGSKPVKEEINNGIKIDSKVRYAVQVVTNVGISESPKLTFEDTKLTVVDSVQVLNIKLKNSDIFLSKTKINIEIFDNNGKQIKNFETIQKKIYPDKCSVFEVKLLDLPIGKYTGIIMADNGKDLFGSNLSLDIH